LEMNGSSGLPPTVAGTVVTVGTFDGVHRGHLDVIERLVARARRAGLPSLLVSFEPHPLEIVNPGAAPQILTTLDEKLEVIAASGLDYVAIVPFTHDLALFEAREFVERILRDRFRMRELLIGHDHGFGHRRAGNVSVLQELGAEHGFPVDVVEAVSLADGQHVSSTTIRRAIAGGDLGRATAGLGRPYSVSGHVIAGHARGRKLGFATLNLSPPGKRKLLPPDGVYAVRVQAPDGEYNGMLNLGPRPTFGESERSIEAHLFDVDGDFYGKHIRVDFIAFLRDTRKFASADELISQLGKDRESALRALTPSGVAGNLRGSIKMANSTPSVA
ncbi:MAG TPA: bifunctional riboflavin kinase/FAD synthetase, partial [Gemmatimonadaceae bacterium]|nr:bifunctional riboflavin kinase/FAD synthetase [Gemmatimonadaceae bacterium]